MPTTRTVFPEPARQQRPTLGEIAAMVGGEDATRHTAILATGATSTEIERRWRWRPAPTRLWATLRPARSAESPRSTTS